MVSPPGGLLYPRGGTAHDSGRKGGGPVRTEY